MGQSFDLRRWIKARQNPASRALYRLAFGLRSVAVPVVPAVHVPLYRLHRIISTAVAALTRIFWYTPLFQTRLEQPAKRLFLYSGMPLVMGSPRISIGEGCRVSGNTTFTGRTSGAERPVLIIGSNVDIGWHTTLAVGRRIVIGDNVRIAGRAFLAGYPGHPIDAAARAQGLPETDDQVGDIVIEDDVWLATGVTVSAGVTIGRGTIVAAGSVVTKDLPAYVVAAGVPAIVKRSIAPPALSEALATALSDAKRAGPGTNVDHPAARESHAA